MTQKAPYGISGKIGSVLLKECLETFPLFVIYAIMILYRRINYFLKIRKFHSTPCIQEMQYLNLMKIRNLSERVYCVNNDMAPAGSSLARS